MNHQEIFTIPEAPGLRFRVHIEQDDNDEAPWERNDGHGPVRQTSDGLKRPGERVLHKDRWTSWLYDWQAACKLARKEWGCQDIEVAVQADFDRLRRWLRSDWYYVGVCVEVIDDNGDAVTDKYEHALWGIESDCEDYIEETAHELAEQCFAAWRITHGEELRVAEAARQLRADAERWRKFCRLAQRKDLGTLADPDTGKLTYPLYRRWFIDCVDLTAESPQAALDSMKEPG